MQDLAAASGGAPIFSTTISPPYLLFLGDAPDPMAAKTGQGVATWRPDACLGQLRLAGCRADLTLPDMTLEEAARCGAKTLVIGVAMRGGNASPTWLPVFEQALGLGLDIVSGLHQRIADLPGLRVAAASAGRRIVDVRHPDTPLELATGARRQGKRALTVGTDCAVGKMYTALALSRRMHERGLDVDFRATGQTGILIAGSGLCVDGVVGDFVAGAAEALCPAAAPDHWDVVEGQASVLHPSYAGVTLGLVHGAQPDAMVMCHSPSRQTMRGLGERPLPRLADCIDAHESAARLTNPRAKVIGLAFNTSGMSLSNARRILHEAEQTHGLPAIDPMRMSIDPLIDEMLKLVAA